MTLRIGYIPYLNMVPFHRGFGPEAVELGGERFEFERLSPRALGIEAEKGALDAGAMSLVDAFRLAADYEPLGLFGIGVRRAANSVLLFSKHPLSELEGADIAVTEETSTSFRLLQILLASRYGLERVRYGRLGSVDLLDGQADGVLLIGDEALRARRSGVKGLPYVADLGEEWFAWQALPFAFARWMVRKEASAEAKALIKGQLENALTSTENDLEKAAAEMTFHRGGTPQTTADYWAGFAYRLAPAHLESIERFEALLEKICSPA